ncbi:MAG: GNAT family N-acetyltransferase [Clostridia bacterium]|nr:GNAT family N-acetyltransferase [Clostridia bacterium]
MMAELEIKKFDLWMAKDLSELSKNEQNRAFLPDEVFETEADARAAIELFIERYRSGLSPQVYALVERDTGRLIGHVEAVMLRDGSWEIGFHIGESFRGRGYARKGLAMFIPFITDRLGIDELWGICLEENIGSCRVLEGCGFELRFCGEGIYQGKSRKIRKYRKTGR